MEVASMGPTGCSHASVLPCPHVHRNMHTVWSEKASSFCQVGKWTLELKGWSLTCDNFARDTRRINEVRVQIIAQLPYPRINARQLLSLVAGITLSSLPVYS